MQITNEHVAKTKEYFVINGPRIYTVISPRAVVEEQITPLERLATKATIHVITHMFIGNMHEALEPETPR